VRSVGIVLLCVAAAVVYGIVHDQITARVCVEYFTCWLAASPWRDLDSRRPDRAHVARGPARAVSGGPLGSLDELPGRSRRRHRGHHPGVALARPGRRGIKARPRACDLAFAICHLSSIICQLSLRLSGPWSLNLRFRLWMTSWVTSFRGSA